MNEEDPERDQEGFEDECLFKANAELRRGGGGRRRKVYLGDFQMGQL